MAYVPRADVDDPEVMGAVAGAAAIGAGAGLNHLQRRFLHAGRILVAGGWLVLTYATTGHRGGRANAEHVLAGLALLLLGVFLIMLSPVANRFPGMAWVGAAVADAVLFYFFPPEGN